MRANWRRWQLRVTPAFALALLFGGPVRPVLENPNKPGDVATMRDTDQSLVVDEGRRQLDAQVGRLEHVQSRSQALLTVSIALLGFVAAAFGRLDRVDGLAQVGSYGLWLAATATALLSIAVSGAVIVVQADFDQIDVTQVSSWPSPILPHLAGDYAKCVMVGEMTLALRVTAFRIGTRYLCWAALLTALTFVITS
jgi:hypothetical protein